MGDIGGTAQAAASVTDTALNIANQDIMLQKQDVYNSQQAQTQRDWSAQQAAINRQFQAGQQSQAENYNEMMSDTAITRRVADLKNAGINPLLAAGSLGGASTPVMSGMPGSMPSGAAASQGVPSSVDVSPFTKMAQLKLASAQAANLNQNTNKQKVETNIAGDQLAQWDAITTPELLNKQAQVISQTYDLEYAKASMVQESVNLIRNASQQADQATVFGQIKNQIAQMDQETQKATLQTFIKMQNALNTQQAGEAANVTQVQKGALGQTIAYLQAIATPVSQAAGAAHSAASAGSIIKGMIP